MILRYLRNILLWLDIGVNVWGFGGSPYETISSRVGKQADKGARWACVFCRVLDVLLGKWHCQTSRVEDQGKTLNNWWKGVDMYFIKWLMQWALFSLVGTIFQVLAGTTFIAAKLLSFLWLFGSCPPSLRWLYLSSFGVIVTILNFQLAPLIALFVDSTGYLPASLSWFQTADAPAWGDTSFRANQMGGSTNNWWCATVWATRNPGYGYDYDMGVLIKPGFAFTTNNDAGIEWTGEPDLSKPYPDDFRALVWKDGTIYRTLKQDGNEYFEFLWVKRWGAHYSRIKLGWALYAPVAGQRRNLELTINPWMSYKEPWKP